MRWYSGAELKPHACNQGLYLLSTALAHTKVQNSLELLTLCPPFPEAWPKGVYHVGLQANYKMRNVLHLHLL